MKSFNLPRILFICSLFFVTVAGAVPAPEQLWQFQGIEDINAIDTLPDVDGDGVPEVVVSSYDAGATGDHIYLLSGGSTGVPAVIWSARPNSGASNGGGYGDYCLTSCPDLNGDLFPDVLLGTAWGNRSVHAFNGQTGEVLWTFDSYNEAEAGWIYCVRSLPDRTGDGIPEIVFGVGSNNDQGYLLDGSDGHIIWRFYQSADAIGHTLALPDVNDDGIADVLFCGWDNEPRVFCVSGAGSNTGQLLWSTNTGSSNHTATLIDDIDDDGVEDIVVGTWGNSNQIRCLSGSTGTILWSYTVGNYEYAMRVVTISDVDNDGYRDLAIGSFARSLPVVSSKYGTEIWRSYAGSLNGGDFWAVDRVDDLTGDGLDEVIGGSFDNNVYLFNGANGDTLWIYNTGSRQYTVRGAPDLSNNGSADVLAGTQYLSWGGRLHALEGSDVLSPVPDFPVAFGGASWLPGRNQVRLEWQCSEPVDCLVYRLAGSDKADAANSLRKHELVQAFDQGDLTTIEVLQELRGQHGFAEELITPDPLSPVLDAEGNWVYQLTDSMVGNGEVSYRVYGLLPQGRVQLLELQPTGEVAQSARLLAARAVPNPFNPRTIIHFELDQAAEVDMKVFDLRGRCVFQQAAASFPAGRNEISWKAEGFGGRAMPAGVYLVNIYAGGESRVIRTTLVR